MDLRIQRACLMTSLGFFLLFLIGAPSPLEKHRDTVSKQAAKSLRLQAPDAAASHRRAPSQCILMPWSRAKPESVRTSSRGMIIPFRVFSRLITRVGHVCTSSSRYAFALTSSSVRWMPFFGTTALTMAPVRDETLLGNHG